LNTAREHVAALTIEVNVAGAEVLIDGVSAGTSPLADAVFVEPGAHRVEAKHEGYADGVNVVQGAQGATLPVTLTLAPAAPVPPARSGDTGGTGGTGPATPPPPQVQGGPNKAVVISGAVVTGIGLGVGIGLVVAAQAKTSGADTALATLTMPGTATLCQTSTCATINSDRQAHDALAKGAVGAFVTAGAIGVATLGYALLSPKGAQKAGARVVPIVGSREAGVAITGAW
jgi:hypothetical protein